MVGSPPICNPSSTCGRYLQYPVSDSPRKEFGLRLEGKYKTSSPNLPLVSIITVVLNRHKTIKRCLLSVLNQTYENIEYIVIDGASTDGTVETIEKYRSSIDYCVSEKDAGIYSAINKGISLSSGSYILILNSDDWYENSAVLDLLTYAQRFDADVTHANAYTVSDQGKVTGRLKGWLHKGLYTRGMPIRHETMLVKNSIYNRFGYYDEHYRILSDYLYLVELYSGKSSFKHLKKEILNFSMHGASNIDIETRHEERSRFFKNMFPFLKDEDVNIMKKKGLLGIRERATLIKKYWHRDDNRLFVQSMAVNILYQAIDFKYLTRLIARFAKLPGIN